METTIQPAGSGAGEGLDFTKSDGSGINKKPMRVSDARASEFEQKGTLSMNDSSTHGNGRVGQLNSVDTSKPLIKNVLPKLGISFKSGSFCCPFHEDKTPSASFGGDKGKGRLWKCHSCGESGDAWTLVKAAKDIEFEDADRWLKTNGFVAEDYSSEKKNGEKEPKVHKTLDRAINACLYGLNGGQSIGDWDSPYQTPYHDQNGNIVVVVVRCENAANGDKQFRQITPRDGGYVCRGPESGIPPLNLPNLDKSKLLVVCEGEKAATAADAMGLQATTWAGGSEATEKTDWNTLKGFDVVIWPDNDEPGTKAAGKIGAHLATVAKRVRILPIDKADDLAEKDDAADILEKYGADAGRQWFDGLLELADDHKPSPALIAAIARPVVVVPLEYNNPAELLDKLTPHLARAGIYQRDGGLCRIVQASESKVKGIGRKAAGGPVVDPHEVHSITPAIGKTVSFYVERVSKSGEIYTVATEPPGKLMQQLLRLKDWPETPPLIGITRAPFMRPDGTICTEPGYDRETGWYLDYTGRPVVVPDKPTRATAEDAARTLLSLIDDFEFLGESHRAAFLTYLLTLVARPGIEGHCPAHVFTANTPGSGKTLLVDVANLIAFGQAPPGYQAPQSVENADEWRKMLFSFAQTGSLSLVISNYPSGQSVGNAPLDMALTEHRIVDRVLGKSETRESAWVAAVAITGNNLGSSADFVFRSIWSVLESSEENPRQRTGFKIADLRGFVLEHRHNLLRKALTILAWHAGEGFPSAGGQHYGSFEEWAKVVRDAVMHLTGHDVLKNNEAAGVADVEADELTTLLMGFKVYAAWKAESLGFKTDDNGIPLKDENGTFIPHSIEDVKVTAANIYDDLDNWDNRTSFSDLRSLADVGKGKRSFESSFGKLINRHKGRVKNLGEEKPQRFKIIVRTYYRRKYVQIVKFQEKETSEQIT